MPGDDTTCQVTLAAILGRLVAQLRAGCRRSQVEFAAEAGLSPAALSRIEAARALADHVQMRRIERTLARDLDIRPGDLMYLVDVAVVRLRRAGVRVRWKRLTADGVELSRGRLDRTVERAIRGLLDDREDDEE
jgi:transcriptional regulator with XRE-family HTH domain